MSSKHCLGLLMPKPLCFWSEHDNDEINPDQQFELIYSWPISNFGPVETELTRNWKHTLPELLDLCWHTMPGRKIIKLYWPQRHTYTVWFRVFKAIRINSIAIKNSQFLNRSSYNPFHLERATIQELLAMIHTMIVKLEKVSQTYLRFI